MEKAVYYIECSCRIVPLSCRSNTGPNKRCLCPAGLFMRGLLLLLYFVKTQFMVPSTSWLLGVGSPAFHCGCLPWPNDHFLLAGIGPAKTLVKEWEDPAAPRQSGREAQSQNCSLFINVRKMLNGLECDSGSTLKKRTLTHCFH